MSDANPVHLNNTFRLHVDRCSSSAGATNHTKIHGNHERYWPPTPRFDRTWIVKIGSTLTHAPNSRFYDTHTHKFSLQNRRYRGRQLLIYLSSILSGFLRSSSPLESNIYICIRKGASSINSMDPNWIYNYSHLSSWRTGGDVTCVCVYAMASFMWKKMPPIFGRSLDGQPIINSK